MTKVYNNEIPFPIKLSPSLLSNFAKGLLSSLQTENKNYLKNCNTIKNLLTLGVPLDQWLTKAEPTIRSKVEFGSNLPNYLYAIARESLLSNKHMKCKQTCRLFDHLKV